MSIGPGAPTALARRYADDVRAGRSGWRHRCRQGLPAVDAGRQPPSSGIWRMSPGSLKPSSWNALGRGFRFDAPLYLLFNSYYQQVGI